MPSKSRESVEYTRRVWDNVYDWYKSADAKAQVVLAIDGAFVAFLADTIFSKPLDQLRPTVAQFSPLTWTLLALMVLSLLLSLGSAIFCLWSRMYSRKYMRLLLNEAEQRHQYPNNYPPEVMWFFQFIEILDQKRFMSTLESVGHEFEVEALGVDIHMLSKSARRKHAAANFGFVFSALTLNLLFASALSYLFSLAPNP